YFSSTYWKHRDLSNLVFLHYADLVRDLDGEMRLLSARLGIAIDEARWPALVDAARFAAMKEKADGTAPGAHLHEWANNADFFRKARHGEWQSVLNSDNLALYERVANERLEPALKRWLEEGRG